ncbi:protein transport protein sec13, putative [Ichthyophthirius multifiliis]|uniref:Protein transport protein sec13, putative n=1 Tax=Ichthyophthirius multifiliis TaxID=5932 RepID=G0QN65_ICHMU|nr:protein transport protein sec13, putative [Ichthyophthirius multifiliis]EGR33337.1 protein transport protein sec13, putative [Ichthyophthirius multifiliis]|eukprot:XP_004037323.1 protein transport protein sec13, putative [Ichthyophthirius multifiliis]
MMIQENDIFKYEHILLNTLSGHTNWVRDVAWSPSFGNNYDTIASCSEDGKVIIWKLYPNKDYTEYEQIKKHQVIEKFGVPVWRISWSQTGNMLAVSGTNVNQDNIVVVFQENENSEWEQISVLEQEEDNGKN